MSSNGRLVCNPLFLSLRAFLPRKVVTNHPAKFNFLRALIFIVSINSIFATGCSRKVRHYTAKEAVAAFSEQASKVQTERGRAWISVKAPEQSLSFPAVIVIDRTDPKRPWLRIEAMDPVGATHALIVMDDKLRFTSIDFDHQRVMKLRESWYGLPLSKLPELLLGLAAIPPDGVVGAADESGFQIRAKGNAFQYAIDWIDPGPRIALRATSGEVVTRSNKLEKYLVEYSKFLDHGDFYLPQEIRVQTPQLEIKLAWRERRWNEKIPREVFVVSPEAFKGFQQVEN